MDSKGKYETVHRKAKVRYEKDVMKNYQPSQEFLEKKARVLEKRMEEVAR
jgi:hypothetical protein